MLASRLLTILMLLQTRGRMSAQALAAEVEVSVRTLYRDIDQLSAAGVPVYAERGRNGGFQLLDGYRTKLTGLTQAEAEALFLAGLPGPAAELGLGEAMATAQLKLLTALPSGWRAEAGRLGARFHLDPVGWFRDAAPAHHLQQVARAVWDQAKIRIRYRSWTGEVVREADPLGVVLKAGAWYLVAAVDGAPRTYRISEIQEMATLDGGFEPPPGFDLAAYWREAAARFEADIYRERARVRLSPAGVTRMQQLGPVAEAALAGAGAPDGEGWVAVDLPVESVARACEELLKLGAEVEAIEPAELRKALRRTAEKMLEIYGVRP